MAEVIFRQAGFVEGNMERRAAWWWRSVDIVDGWAG